MMGGDEMEPSQTFKELLEASAATLKREGFSRSGQTFFLQADGNWGLVNFQRTMGSSRVQIIFTINLGIASARLLKIFPPPRARATGRNTRPGIWDCHWQERIGHLLPERKDIWWKIGINSQIERLGDQINTYLRELAIPEIKKYISDEALCDLWLTERSPGLTQLQRLEYLSVLVKAVGPQELLEPVLEQLRHLTNDTKTDIRRPRKEITD
jgi:hypothetical protein